MSAGSLVSVCVALAVVLGLMGIALRFLRRYATGGGTTGGAVRMEVVQRLSLGQRQGIAVVRIGTRVLAVSMGDGGIQPVAELDESDLAAPDAVARGIAPAVAGVASGVATGVAGRLRKIAYRSAPEAKPTAERISYIAPIEDFQEVLSLAMGGTHHVAVSARA